MSSKSFSTNDGVSQGSVISPTHFLIYINDLIDQTSNPAHCYADDSTLHGKPSLPNNRNNVASSITLDLEQLKKWASQNLVSFNANKTQCCLISRSKNKNLPDILFGSNTPKMWDSLSMLGVSVASDLSWNEHISSAARKIAFLFRSKRFFTPLHLLTLYKARIRPCLEYGSHLWRGASKYSLATLDTIQKRAIRLIDDSSLTDSLAHRRNVSALSLYYRYYHGRCSDELKSVIPHKACFALCRFPTFFRGQIGKVPDHFTR